MRGLAQWYEMNVLPNVCSTLTSLAIPSPFLDFGKLTLYCSSPVFVTACALLQFSLKWIAARKSLKKYGRIFYTVSYQIFIWLKRMERKCINIYLFTKMDNKRLMKVAWLSHPKVQHMLLAYQNLPVYIKLLEWMNTLTYKCIMDISIATPLDDNKK